MVDEEKLIESIAMYIFDKALGELSTGPLPVVERFKVDSDGEDLRITLKIAGSSKVYLFPIIELLHPQEVKMILDEFYTKKKKIVNNLIATIRNKGG